MVNIAWYKIYAGLSGGFGGAHFQSTEEFTTKDEANSYAYEVAVGEYQSYEGCHGILSWKDCQEDLNDSFPDTDFDDEDVDERYQEEIESWIEYYVVLTNRPEDTDDDSL